MKRVSAALVAVAAVALLLAVADSPVTAAAPNDLSLRATYRVAATLHWQRGTLDVSSTATVANTAGGALRALTFNLVTLQTGNARITSVAVGGQPAKFSAAGQTVVVRLAKPLPKGAKAHVRIDYRADFNAAPSGSHRDLFEKQDGIVTAYRWIPWLSRAQAFNAPNFGETWVTGVSPRVFVALRADRQMVYAANGAATSRAPDAATFVAHNVRDFNFSASPRYSITTVMHHGVKVRFYTVDGTGSKGPHGPPMNVRKWTLAALDRFDRKLGGYPYRYLTVAMTPGGSGMESPGMTWISTTEPPANLAYLSVHEVAHQWFYGIVGNNQATQPFLDEGVSDFLARDALNDFRDARCDPARLDGTTYDYKDGCYNEIVYVQSSQYINAYRDYVGATKFWTGLNRFVRHYRFQISNTREFWQTLDAATGYNSKRHKDRFPSLFK